MKVRYLNSFLRGFEPLPVRDRQKVTGVVSGLLNIIEKRARPSKGLGIRKLRNNLWEARIDINARILFALEAGLITFAFVGSHDKIKRYLKR